MEHMEIDAARKILGLPEKATIPEIKKAYQKMALKYHPDKCGDKDRLKCTEKIKEINNANQALIEYCLNYKLPLTGEADNNSLEEKVVRDHMKRFYDGWWGDLNA